MPRPNHLIVAVLAAALCLGVSACGSGDSEPLTKAEFIQQGNEICKEATTQRGEDLKAATEDSDGSGDEEEMESFVSTALESVQDMAEELEDLNPPPAQEKEVKALVSSLEKGIAKTEADPSQGIDGSAFEEANELSAEHGLSDCQV